MIFWDRATLKDRAKQVLKTSYWMSLLVTVLVGIASGGASGVNVTYSFNSYDLNRMAEEFRYGMQSAEEVIRIMLPFFGVVAIGGSLIAIVYSVFVSNIVSIGQCRYFTLCRYGRVDMGEALFGFKNGKYMSNVKTMFFMNLYIFLWSLLLIIPGIIKSLQYSMVPYILAENPNISTERALEISTRMTDGEKGEIFVLGLSFLGWYMLGLLACGVGMLFVAPYAQATYAELYGALRYKAVQNGICDKTELGAEL